MRNGKHYTAIVLAGGRGSRMKADQPKQYLLMAGKPVLYYALKAFEESDVDQIVLVTGEGEEDYCREKFLEAYGFQKITRIVAGGAERYDSVWKGLKAIEETDYVLIHDGARPLISQSVIRECMDQVVRSGACVAGVPVKDTIKRVDSEKRIQETPDRQYLWSVQTPQTFAWDLVYPSYEKLEKDLADKGKGCMPVSITDDTMVVAYYTEVSACMVESTYDNLKITTPEDLVLAEILLSGSTYSCK